VLTETSLYTFELSKLIVKLFPVSGHPLAVPDDQEPVVAGSRHVTRVTGPKLSTTADIYSHVTELTKRKAAKAGSYITL
jgi:hypothetical protein